MLSTLLTLGLAERRRRDENDEVNRDNDVLDISDVKNTVVGVF